MRSRVILDCWKWKQKWWKVLWQVYDMVLFGFTVKEKELFSARKWCFCSFPMTPCACISQCINWVGISNNYWFTVAYQSTKRWLCIDLCFVHVCSFLCFITYYSDCYLRELTKILHTSGLDGVACFIWYFHGNHVGWYFYSKIFLLKIPSESMSRSPVHGYSLYSYLAIAGLDCDRKSQQVSYKFFTWSYKILPDCQPWSMISNVSHAKQWTATVGRKEGWSQNLMC